ncbi:MAG: ABC transporter ATP-binding protein [Amphritea sp.]
MSNDTPLLELQGITKQYPGCLANDNVNLTIMPGEVHALLGENGAGKSTLVKYIYGVIKADTGRLLWNGEETNVTSPNFARKLGIGMVFQHFSLFDAMTVAENIALGMSDAPPPSELEPKIIEVSEKYGLPLDPKRLVHDLSVGERQRIEIVRCLLQEPKLLIMDEPTSVLTPQEVERLFVTLNRLKDEGCSILYISHKLEEVKAICQGATILRGGREVGACDPREETAKTMAEMMIGTDLVVPEKTQTVECQGNPRLLVNDLTIMSDQQFGTHLHAINLAVFGGEIVGIAGVAGNGQTELMEVLSGEMLCASEEMIMMDGNPVGLLGPTARRKLGGAFVPEERLGHGAVPDMPLHENTLLSAITAKNLLKFGFIKLTEATQFAKYVVKKFKVKTAGVEATAASLSGGNLQKFIVGREVLQAPDIFIVSQPTWGVDAGAAAAIHQSIIDLAATGAAVLVISQELDELFTICDRIAVIAEGRLSDARKTADVTVEEIGLLMGGTHDLPNTEGKANVA